MSQELTTDQQEQLSSVKDIQTAFQYIVHNFVATEKKEECKAFIDQLYIRYPRLLHEGQLKSYMKELNKKKKKATKPRTTDDFATRLKSSVVTRHFVVSTQEIPMPTSAASPDETVEKLKEVLTRQQHLNGTTIYLKIAIGSWLCHLNHLLDQKAKLGDMLQHVGISISKADQYFCMKLAKLANEFQRLAYVSLPVGDVRKNMKSLEEILRKDAGYWMSPM